MGAQPEALVRGMRVDIVSALSSDLKRILTAKSKAELLGSRFGTAWAGRMGEIKYRAFPSRRQSLRAATGSLEENVLPLCDTDSVRESKRF